MGTISFHVLVSSRRSFLSLSHKTFWCFAVALWQLFLLRWTEGTTSLHESFYVLWGVVAFCFVLFFLLCISFFRTQRRRDASLGVGGCFGYVLRSGCAKPSTATGCFFLCLCRLAWLFFLSENRWIMFSWSSSDRTAPPRFVVVFSVKLSVIVFSSLSA